MPYPYIIVFLIETIAHIPTEFALALATQCKQKVHKHSEIDMPNAMQMRNCPTRTLFHMLTFGLALGLRGFLLPNVKCSHWGLGNARAQCKWVCVLVEYNLINTYCDIVIAYLSYCTSLQNTSRSQHPAVDHKEGGSDVQGDPVAQDRRHMEIS